MDLAAIHATALKSFGSIIDAVGKSQWEDTTPCTEWNVRQLMNHVVNENLWVAPLMEGKTIAEVGNSLDGDLVGDDPSGAYERSAKSAKEAVSGPEVLDDIVHLSYGDLPASVFIGHRIVDLIVHGWDLADATDQEAESNSNLWKAVWEIIEPELDGLQDSGVFGQRQLGFDSADVQKKVLANLGRKPA